MDLVRDLSTPAFLNIADEHYRPPHISYCERRGKSGGTPFGSNHTRP